MSEFSPEQHEAERMMPTATTLTKEALIERIYQGKSLPQDKRFLPKDEGGVFQHFYVPDLIRPDMAAMTNGRPEQVMYFPVVEANHQIVGLAKLASSTLQENVFWIMFVNVDPKYQGQKFGSKLAEEIFRFAKEKGIRLEASSYTDEGQLKLKKKLGDLAKESGVPFKEQSGRRLFG